MISPPMLRLPNCIPSLSSPDARLDVGMTTAWSVALYLLALRWEAIDDRSVTGDGDFEGDGTTGGSESGGVSQGVMVG